MAGKYWLTTLGCKVNQYETEQIREMLESLGFQAAGWAEAPDIAVVNTCAVTGSASRKSRQSIRRLARGGEVPTVVVGCYATAAAETLRRIPGVIAILGHDTHICAELRAIAKHRLGSPADRTPGRPGLPTGTSGGGAFGDDVRTSADASVRQRSDPKAAETPPSNLSISNSTPYVNDESDPGPAIQRFAGRQRAFLKVQDGCDAFCTYCIIPRLRPRLSYKPIAEAVAEARGLVRAGHHEIVVTGIYLGAYGRATAIRSRFRASESPPSLGTTPAAAPAQWLAELVEALASIEGLVRLRLSSLEPQDIDAALLSVLQRHDCCVPHLHLPLQAGSDAVLRRMNRQYTAGQYLDMIERVKAALDRPAITTDIVVGFPGETEEEFEATLDIARRAGFCKIHAFPFSPRPGTAAAKWTDRFVDPATVKARMQRLARIGRETADRYLRSFLGCTERVIVEDSSPRENREGNNGALRHGRTDRYFEVFFDAPRAAPGDVVQVRIDRVTPARVHGTLVETPARDDRTATVRERNQNRDRKGADS